MCTVRLVSVVFFSVSGSQAELRLRGEWRRHLWTDLLESWKVWLDMSCSMHSQPLVEQPVFRMPEPV